MMLAVSSQGIFTPNIWQFRRKMMIILWVPCFRTNLNVILHFCGEYSMPIGLCIHMVFAKIAVLVGFNLIWRCGLSYI